MTEVERIRVRVATFLLKDMLTLMRARGWKYTDWEELAEDLIPQLQEIVDG